MGVEADEVGDEIKVFNFGIKYERNYNHVRESRADHSSEDKRHIHCQYNTLSARTHSGTLPVLLLIGLARKWTL